MNENVSGCFFSEHSVDLHNTVVIDDAGLTGYNYRHGLDNPVIITEKPNRYRIPNRLL